MCSVLFTTPADDKGCICIACQPKDGLVHVDAAEWRDTLTRLRQLEAQMGGYSRRAREAERELEMVLDAMPRSEVYVPHEIAKTIQHALSRFTRPPSEKDIEAALKWLFSQAWSSPPK
ncbi:hypothetical protein D779_2074 [Imhoffiella purpurea]|uniref:Uncharacterized protein n=2 Tax=Imhoffiella purpurea TaxID=1249627 RepID=W9V5R9_9GAMM|nr:hypothetical protein D779_2074 [Imhoffiella purpurea]